MSGVGTFKSSSQSELKEAVKQSEACMRRESEVDLKGKDGSDIAKPPKERTSAQIPTKKQSKFKLPRSRLVSVLSKKNSYCKYF